MLKPFKKLSKRSDLPIKGRQYSGPCAVTIYALVDPLDDTVRYVGQTNCPVARLNDHKYNTHANLRLRLWIAGLMNSGKAPRMVKLETKAPGEKADKAEKYWIRYLRERFDLYNLTEGGTGKRSVEWAELNRTASLNPGRAARIDRLGRVRRNVDPRAWDRRLKFEATEPARAAKKARREAARAAQAAGEAMTALCRRRKRPRPARGWAHPE